MKKYFIIFILLSFVFLNIYSQKRNAFKANLFSPIFKTGSFFYERKVSDALSLQLGFLFTEDSKFLSENLKMSGYAFTPEIRFYPSKNEDVKGFYLAPYFRYRTVDIKNVETGGLASLTSYGGGLLIGGQFIFGNIVVLDAFIGPNYMSRDLKVKSGSEDDFSTGSLAGFGLRAGIAIGIAF